jgi:hypothetical protein
MRNAVLYVMAVMLLSVSAGASAQVPPGDDPLPFDYYYQAWSYAYVDWDGLSEGGGSDSDYGENEFARAYVFADGEARGEIGLTPNDQGLLLKSWCTGVGDWGFAGGDGRLLGTFSIAGMSDVTFTAAPIPNCDASYVDWWTLEIWDPANPDVPLVIMDKNNLFVELTLEGNKTYGMELINDNAGWVDIQLSAVPEPATMGLLAIGAAALLRRRK